MARTFEEIAGSELDALYQGALFLAGGSAKGAERLIVEAVTLAFDEHVPDSTVPEARRWLEARLVRAFFRNVQSGPNQLHPDTARRTRLHPDVFDSLDAEALHKAAALLPARPRAALWLVLLRRWSYAEAAGLIGVDESDVPVLLSYRDILVQELLARSGRGDQREVQ